MHFSDLDDPTGKNPATMLALALAHLVMGSLLVPTRGGGEDPPPALLSLLKLDPSVSTLPIWSDAPEPVACAVPPTLDGSFVNGGTGLVTLAFLIGIDGRVLEAKVERSSGHPELDGAALRGLEQCQFRPGTVDGVAQPSWTRIEYAWNLAVGPHLGLPPPAKPFNSHFRERIWTSGKLDVFLEKILWA